MRNSISWVLWLITTMAILLATRHPIYLVILLSELLLVGNKIAKYQGISSWAVNNLRFLMTMVLLSTVINAFFTHVGSTIVFRLPENWVLIGGNITLESIIYGLINGLVIGSMYITFNITNLALNTKQITGLIPRAFHPIAMTVTVALTFFPSIQQRAREIKEAQMIRGNPMKHISDWLPLFVPLLVTSLENAFQLSESMTARGFHTKYQPHRQEYALMGLIIATFVIFSAWLLRLYNYPKTTSIILYAIGAFLLIAILYKTSQRTQITRYHQETWGRKDILPSVLLGLIIIGWVMLRIVEQGPDLEYTPYPTFSLPSIQFAGILLSLVPLLPILFIDHD